MKTNISLPAKRFVWGNPDRELDNSGYAIWLLLLGVLFVCIAAACFYWSDTLLLVRPESRPGAEDGANGWFGWGFVELCIVLIFSGLAISPHFRLDSFQANAEGMYVDYSHISKFAGDYVNERIFVPWREVISVTKEDDGEGTFIVDIFLKKPLAIAGTHLSLTCANEVHAAVVSHKLQGLASHLLKAPKS